MCQCACGAVRSVFACNLTSGASTQCRACGALASARALRRRMELKRAAIEARARLEGRTILQWRRDAQGRPQPLYACVRCNSPTTRRYCVACGRRVCQKYPVPLARIGARFGVSKQWVSMLVRKYGFNAAVRRLESRQVA